MKGDKKMLERNLWCGDEADDLEDKAWSDEGENWRDEAFNEDYDDNYIEKEIANNVEDESCYYDILRERR